MENHNDESEANAKVSDSAYSNSCSNSQSRSNSSKSTHSGSNSSGSSGYGGKQSSGSSVTKTQSLENNMKDKEPKKKNNIDTTILEVPLVVENGAIEDNSKVNDADNNKDYVMAVSELSEIRENENMEIPSSERASPKEEAGSYLLENKHSILSSNKPREGFSCVISLNDGVVMFTTSLLTSSLGYPNDLWLGRSFLDFLHPKDRNTFASQITHDLVSQKNIKDLQGKVHCNGIFVSSMFCRIRKYRSLTNSGFNIKDSAVTYIPFSLKLSLKDIIDDSGKETYLVIQATPCVSAFKMPNERICKATSFVIRHTAAGRFAYLDPESVTYLGYLPQDMVDKCVLHLYHPDDLRYLHRIYETIVKEGTAPRSKSFRIMAQNGDYVKIETEWSSFINPWSRKLEFVIGKHHVVEGPKKPDIFLPPPLPERATLFSEDQNKEIKSLRNGLIRIMNEVLTKPDEVAKQEKTKRCRDLTVFMESLIQDAPKHLELEIECTQIQQEQEHSSYERDSVMLGGISPHRDNSDSKSSTETPLSYTQLNYNDNLDRYFESREQCSFIDDKTENMTDKEASRSTASDLYNTSLTISSGDELASSGDSDHFAASSSSDSFIDDNKAHLTEHLLTKHNSEMEKNLIKKHREMRFTIREERENKAPNETQKKNTLNEHLARCNAAFQPTDAQSHGTKRGAQHFNLNFSTTKQYKGEKESRPEVTTKTTSKFQTTNTMPQPHYGPRIPISGYTSMPRPSGYNYHETNIVPIPLPGPLRAATDLPPVLFNMDNWPKVTVTGVSGHTAWYKGREAPYITPLVNKSLAKKYGYDFQETTLRPVSLPVQYVVCPMYAIQNQHLSTRTAPEKLSNVISGNFHKCAHNSRPIDLTYKHYSECWAQENIIARAARVISQTSCEKNCHIRNTSRRKIVPHWMDQVCASSDLIYKYQVNIASKEVILTEDQDKIDLMKQPLLVNEQLGQLYLDMQLVGVASRLSLEGASNSSSSSDEDTSSCKVPLRFLRHSMDSIIYQEDAPLPPPDSINEDC